MVVDYQRVHGELEALISDSKNKEKECRRYLRYVRDLLVDVTSATFLDEAEEYRGHSGDSDYIIVCRALEESGIESNKAYIWEAKAPQVYLFQQDTNNRVKPTKQFVSAENQLLHYYEECRGSEQFREEFGITHGDDVRLGGLIIGSRATWVKGSDYDETTLDRLYKKALNLRTRYLYGHSGIKVMIWDHILQVFENDVPPRQSGKHFHEPVTIQSPNYTVVDSED